MTRLADIISSEHRDALSHTVLVRHRLEEQYADLEHQSQTAQFGMWVFLATEVMTFGALFLVLGVYSFMHPEPIQTASAELKWKIGTANAILLLISSFTMTLSVHFARLGKQSAVTLLLLITALIGIAFLGLKGYEYYTDYQHHLIPGWRFHEHEWVVKHGLAPAQVPHVKLFLVMYWIMTLAHVLHLSIGITAVVVIALLSWQRRFDRHYHGPVEVASLYWSFVDIIWLFLLAMLYLQGTHHQL